MFSFKIKKNNMMVSLSILMTFLFVGSGVQANMYSDVNQDGVVNTTDAMLVLRNSLGLDMSGTKWDPSAIDGNIDCKKSENCIDAMLILKYSLGLAEIVNTGWHEQVRAFTGAEGGGADSVGGRGGIVYEVINLNDGGPGSLRYGLTAAKYKKVPRTIVFKVGGYIHLKSHILVSNDSFITIAGQTAPGSGITIVYPSNPNDGVLEFRNSHDVIMRYISIRKGGDAPNEYHQQGSNLSIIGNSYNIMVDHCSIGWAGDENVGTYNDAKGGGKITPHNITFQWSISSENLRRPTKVNGKMTDSTGFMAGTGANAESGVDVSIHHNLFARNNNRNPLFKVGSGDVSANIIYNWGWWAAAIRGGSVLDMVDNVFVAGPARRGSDKRPEVTFIPATKGNAATGAFRDLSLYFDGNIGYHNTDPNKDAWDTMMHHANNSFGYLNGKVTPVSRDYQRKTKRSSKFPITRENALSLNETLLKKGGVGNSRRLDKKGNWVYRRDVIDTRVINDYNNRTGKTLVSSVDMVGGWPYYNNGHYQYVTEEKFIAHPKLYQLDSGTPYVDSDHDGMSDLWEGNNGLDKRNSNDGKLDRNGDGYTNLEEFLNGA